MIKFRDTVYGNLTYINKDKIISVVYTNDGYATIHLQGDIHYRLNKADSVDLRKILEMELIKNESR